MTIITRFAPSPTGFLHIGGVRTALYNWLYAKHHGGRFLLRIEDTDRKRSTTEAREAILDGLKWLGLNWDGEAVSQFSRAANHVNAAKRLLDEGKAYQCYCTPDELAQMRNQARSEGRSMLYDGRWRDKPQSAAPQGVKPVIRLKSPQDGETVINDLVQGEITVANDQLDDMVLLRADGTPTYMLAVVVDDHDMNISHVIRGDDHLTNAFRQTTLYQALGWQSPQFAHIPLIHGADGAKMSKRHGAPGADAYKEMGFLPEALCNYLLRLGWGHGDDEIISREQAIEWFELNDVGRSPARFDMAKLSNLNGQYIRHADNVRLAQMTAEILAKTCGETIPKEAYKRLVKGMCGLKERAKTIIELAENARFYVNHRPLEITQKAQKILTDEAIERLRRLWQILSSVDDWNATSLNDVAHDFSERENIKLAMIAQPLRAALTGSNVSPGIFEVMEVLGKNETMGRIEDIFK